MRSRYPDKSVDSFEYRMWLFTRVSGVFMLLTGAFGLVVANLMGGRTQMDLQAQARWSFFPISYHVVNTDIPDVFPNWSNPFWQLTGMMLVLVAITHGFNGLRVVVEDYVHNSLLLAILKWAVFFLWAFTAGCAALLIFSL